MEPFEYTTVCQGQLPGALSLFLYSNFGCKFRMIEVREFILNAHFSDGVLSIGNSASSSVTF